VTPGLVDARWVASFEADLPDRTHLVPNETVVAIPQGEAEASDHWEIVGKTKPPTVKELKARLAELGVEAPKGAKKPEIEELIAKAETPRSRRARARAHR
jgi:hypothetical protein